MKRNFSKLLAALALLVFMAPSLVGWGQTTTLLTEDFSAITNGNNTTTSGSASAWNGNDNFPTVSSAYQAGGAVKLGTGSKSGSITSKSLSVSAGTLTVAFDVKGWSSVEGNVKVTVGSQNQSVTYSAVMSDSFESKSVDFLISANADLTVKLETTAKRAFLDNVVVTNTVSGGDTPELEDSDLAITGAPVTLNFDLYNNSAAQTVNFTTSSTGAVTVSGGEGYVTTSVSGTTITVTPTAVTPSLQTITVSQAADDTYAAGSATFTVEVEDSTPFNGVIFTAGTDTGSTTSNNSPDEITKDNVHIYGTDAAFATAEYRMYKNSTTTISTTDGSIITKIEFTNASSNPATGFGSQAGWSTNNNGGIWEGEATSVSFVASGAQVRATIIKVWVTPNANPFITAENVNIAYDAEEGTINYTINNPVNGGSITASCDAEWIEVDDTPQTSSTGSIDFICYPNSNFYAHSATVTLTYTYSDSKATVTKDVTVTQALDPDANGSTAEYPIMVSEAIEAIDEVSNVSNIYVVGIVSEIVEEYNSTYGNITFDMIDEEGNEYFLRAYRCGGDEAANVMVGDEAVVYGNLYKYNNLIYEFASGCQLVSLTHPVVPAITVDPSTVEATAAETEGTLNVTYTAIETSLGASIYWYTDNTGTTTTDEPNWISADVDETTLNVDYVIAENNGEARTAYLKVYGVDEELNDVYSDLVTINQAGALQQYTLTVEPFENLELITFVNDEMVMEGDGDIQVNEGDHIMLSIVADEGYVMETLMVNSVNHVNDIAADFTYEFDMPAEDVTISATAVEDVAPVSSDYVRITSLDQLTDGSIVVIAARYDEEHTNGYYAMTNATSGKPTGVLFTSTTSGDNEILPASIAENEDNYYWVVNETENGYTFTNAEGFLIGYTSSTNFATGGNNTEWTINSITASSTSMVPNYAGFKIVNVNQNGRAFALNESHNYAPYSTSNLNGSDAYKYNFSLDFFVQSEAPVTETYTLEITGYEEGSNGGYYLIASPVTVDPATVDGMTSGDFDLYYYDESNDNEWRNYEANAFNLEPGKGYLYAKQATTEGEVFNFTLTGTPYAGNGTVELDYNEDSEFPGFNLIGNPFGTNATLNMPYYRLNSDRSGLNTSTETTEINVMEGVFVEATAEIQTATFSTGAKRVNQLNIKVTRNRGTVLDNAIIRFDNGATLGKFQINPDATKLYITEGNQDYAVVCSNNEGEMPVSFKAAENGNYTLSVDAENVEVSYLHLIDNMNNADIDLLATPSYSFDARTTDNANRFRLVFNTNGVDENTTTASFAYFNGSEWTISNMGEATLQVVDMMGRVLSTQAISGNTEVSISQVPGVYMLRLINGENVMVQKVVVR